MLWQVLKSCMRVHKVLSHAIAPHTVFVQGQLAEEPGTLEWEEQFKVIQKQGDQISKVFECGLGEGASDRRYVSTREHDPRWDRARESSGRNLSFGWDSHRRASSTQG